MVHSTRAPYHLLPPTPPTPMPRTMIFRLGRLPKPSLSPSQIPTPPAAAFRPPLSLIQWPMGPALEQGASTGSVAEISEEMVSYLCLLRVNTCLTQYPTESKTRRCSQVVSLITGLNASGCEKAPVRDVLLYYQSNTCNPYVSLRISKTRPKSLGIV